ncbi:MAG: hypothetical protein ABI456_16750 [Ktedonobacteraceae bacterium]
MRRQRLRGRGHEFATLFTAISFGLLLMLVGVAFAACGSTITGSGGQPTPTVIAKTQQCGKIHTLGPNGNAGPQQTLQTAEQCFLQAFQHCQPATLTYSQSGVDAGVIHTFKITNNNGTCAVTDTAQHFVAPRPPTTATTYTCTDVKQVGGETIVSACGQEGSVKLPPASYTSP